MTTTAIPDREPGDRGVRAAAQTVQAIREAASTAEMVALTCDAIAASWAEAVGGQSLTQRSARQASVRHRADAHRDVARRLWARAAALEAR